MMIMSLRVSEKQSPATRGDCFAVARNDMWVNALREKTRPLLNLEPWTTPVLVLRECICRTDGAGQRGGDRQQKASFEPAAKIKYKTAKLVYLEKPREYTKRIMSLKRATMNPVVLFSKTDDDFISFFSSRGNDLAGNFAYAVPTLYDIHKSTLDGDGGPNTTTSWLTNLCPFVAKSS